MLSSKPEWQSFSLNPGLRRLDDYQRCAPFAAYAGEKALSKRYAELNLTAVRLEGDAVLHTGFGLHVSLPEERRRKDRRRQRDRVKLVVILVVGMVMGAAVGFLVH
ncbi:hypothetical protein D3C78_1269270 [compost metagenome]